jgi:hypothetical protein
MNWVVGVVIAVVFFSLIIGAGIAIADGRILTWRNRPKPVKAPEPEPETLEDAAKRVEKELAAEWDDEFRRLNRAYRPAPEPYMDVDPWGGRGELIEEKTWSGETVMRFWLPPEPGDEPEGSGRSRG